MEGTGDHMRPPLSELEGSASPNDARWPYTWWVVSVIQEEQGLVVVHERPRVKQDSYTNREGTHRSYTPGGGTPPAHDRRAGAAVARHDGHGVREQTLSIPDPCPQARQLVHYDLTKEQFWG